jgi:hypothetical protein
LRADFFLLNQPPFICTKKKEENRMLEVDFLVTSLFFTSYFVGERLNFELKDDAAVLVEYPSNCRVPILSLFSIPEFEPMCVCPRFKETWRMSGWNFMGGVFFYQ